MPRGYFRSVLFLGPAQPGRGGRSRSEYRVELSRNGVIKQSSSELLAPYGNPTRRGGGHLCTSQCPVVAGIARDNESWRCFPYSGFQISHWAPAHVHGNLTAKNITVSQCGRKAS